MRPLLIGEAPSRTSDPLRPFSGTTGGRIVALAGQPLEQSWQLANLLPAWPGRAGKGTRWDRAAARRAALALDVEGRRVVFVGRRVAAAFGHQHAPFLEWLDDPERGCRFAVLPHPSGIVRWWNEPANADAARSFLRGAIEATCERPAAAAPPALRPGEQLAQRLSRPPLRALRGGSG